MSRSRRDCVTIDTALRGIVKVSVMVEGQILDADGSAVIHDLFAESGVTQHTEIDHDLDAASPAPGVIRRKCHDIRHKIEDEFRPTRAPVSGERVALGLKVTAEVKQRIDEEARKTGRTQSQQAELMIERAFALLGDTEVFGLARAVTSAMDTAGRLAAAASAKTSWIDDPWCYDHALTAAIKVLDALRPPGAINHPSLKGAAVYEAEPGAVQQLLSNIGSMVADQVIEQLRGDLGPVAARLNSEYPK